MIDPPDDIRTADIAWGDDVHADEMRALEGVLDRLRVLYEELKRLNGGVAVLHIEAAVGSLESHLRRQRATVD